VIIFSSFFEFDFFLQTRNNDKCFLALLYTFLYSERHSNNLVSSYSCRSNWYYTSGRCRKLLFL